MLRPAAFLAALLTAGSDPATATTSTATTASTGGRAGNADTQYGGRTFVAAAAFCDRVLCSRGRSRLRCLTDWRGMLATITFLRTLPRLSITLTERPTGQAIRAYLLQRGRLRIRNRLLAQGVLELPPTMAEYRKGRQRQAMRTNVTQAERLGMHCEQLETELERHAMGDWFCSEPWQTAKFSDLHRTCWVVLNSNNRPIALASVTVAAETAILWSIITIGSPERWLLHTQIVETLIGTGVRVLLIDGPGALRLDPGLQYFQRRLGYRIAHLTLAR